MTTADLKMVKVMLILIRDNAREKNEIRTAEQIDALIEILDDKIGKPE